MTGILILATPGVKQVVIDEVQKLPELLDVVHWMIEEKARDTTCASDRSGGFDSDG